jgi:UDP-glucose 4-epimerase
MLSRPWSFKLLESASHLAAVRAVKHAVPWFTDRGLNISCLPINEDIQLGQDVVLPIQLLHDLIDVASHRVIVDFCACRRAMACRRYPAEIGCLMMGEAALEINRTVGREVTAAEAREHLELAVSNGLVPFVGKARIDNVVFGIRNKKQLLSTCFCCECCCISRFARHVPPGLRAENIHRLDGLHLEVADSCDGCGACAEHCFLREIEVVDGRAVIGEGCAGCGRCAQVCRRGAISVSLDNPAFIREARDRIESLVDF